MFGRRRRGSSNPPLDRSAVNPNATTAAAQAFLASKSSTVSLASAAAGAALRSRPTTPTSVADVQTKRTVRRQNSNSSSVASSVAGTPRPILERRNSSGSMTERTFRDQSPGRGSIREASVDAPPVPAIPDNLKPAIPPKSHRRSNSLEATPERVVSPQPTRTNGRGSSMGPLGARATPGRGGLRNASLSSLQELTGAERPASRGSVNFSYPTNSTRAMSPARSMRLTSLSPLSNRRSSSMQNAQPIQNGTNLVYDPNTRSFRPASEVYAYDDYSQEEEEKPVRKKKAVQPKGTASGSQIPSGSVFGGPKGTAVNAMNAAASQKQEAQPAQSTVQPRTIVPNPAPKPVIQSQTIVPAPTPQPPAAVVQPTPVNSAPSEVDLVAATEPKKKKKKRVTIPSESGSEQGYTSNMSSDNESDSSDYPQKTKARPGLHKRPSVVRELPEDEESDYQTITTPQNSQKSINPSKVTSPTPLPRSNGSGARGKGRVKALASETYAQEKQHTRSASESGTETSALPTEPNGSTDSPIGRGNGSVRSDRTVSISPARTTRFAAESGKPTTLTVMHQPPPRSISPRKSAMKNSNSPRGTSPSDDMLGSWSGRGQTASDLSDNSMALDDQRPRKKKTNRVSFDETNTIVGTAAPSVPSEASILPSPQTKRSWFSLKNKGNKNVNGGDEEEDEFMKPRPELPSFGSVRERKVRAATEERPLVIPSDSHSISNAENPSSSLFTSQNGKVTGASSDQLVGSILAQDAVSTNKVNTPKFLEPLPPEVTSVEGTGYSSDSSVYDSAREREANLATSGQRNGTTTIKAEPPQNLSSPNTDHLVFDDVENKDLPASSTKLEVPEIAVIGSTPTLEETEEKKEWIVPGGFPSGNSDSDSDDPSEADTIVPKGEPTPASVGIAEPPVESIHLGSNGTPVEIPSSSAIVEDTDESESVYDDAAEDLSDGDGFLSLNAVAASPIQTLFPTDQTPGLAISTPPESPTDRSVLERAFRKAKNEKGASEPDMGEGWDKTQQYWSGLTADKKRELEREAHDEAETSEEEEEEDEVSAPPTPKAKKRVVVEPVPVVLPTHAQSSHRTYQIPPGSKAPNDGQLTMRTSMRSPPQNKVQDTNTHMRKSMRNGRSNQGSIRESSETLPAVQPRGSLQKRNRPMSHPPPVSQSDPVAIQNHIRRMSTAPVMSTPVNGKAKVAAAPQLRRTNSTDSDSSFKRIRPTSHSMRGSMRNPVTQDRSERRNTRSYSPDGEKPKSSIFRIRSLSPTGSAGKRSFNSTPPVSSGQGTMRGTMRNASKDSGKNFGFGKSSTKAQPKSKATAPRSRSRFADSSDEEDVRPAFRSRFGDSSDEDDEPLPVPGRTMRSSTLRSTPVSTPAPKKRLAVINDGDSSDLPDSDDEKPAPAAQSRQPQPKQQPRPISTNSTSLRRSGSGRENISSPVLRTPQKQQRTFLGILRRKKDPESKVRKPDLESAARRDTPLERSRSELLGVRQNSGSNVLQKRNGPTRANSGGVPSVSSTWPLNSSVKNGVERPATADAVALAEVTRDKRPSMTDRRNTATGLMDVDIVGRSTTSDTITTTATGKNPNVVLGKSGKPKRFMGLRRVLGIKD